MTISKKVLAKYKDNGDVFIETGSHIGNTIQQAVDNILKNAIQFTDEGKITVTLKRARKQLVLIIADTGRGVSAEYYQQMFKPFSQASDGLAREYQGLGLGLTLTKRYLDWNGVEISVESRKDHGSTFVLTFPKADPND